MEKLLREVELQWTSLQEEAEPNLHQADPGSGESGKWRKTQEVQEVEVE